MDSTSASPRTAPELAVIVPTYGRPQTIAALLERLRQQSLAPERFEVVVVDDGSPAPIAFELSTFAFDLKLLRQDNAGPGAARNLALEHVRAPLTLILNDDAVPADDLLEKHLEAHRNCAPKTALLGSFDFTRAARLSPFVQLLQGSNLLFDFPALQHGRRLGWQHFWTCNISLPTRALREVGGFDAATFRDAIVEDVELGYRLAQRGWSVEFRSDLVCEHDHVIAPRAYFERMARLGSNMAKMAAKHDPKLLALPKGAASKTHAMSLVQQGLEAYYGAHVALLEKLERLEREQWGAELPAALRIQISGLVQQLGLLDYWRGLQLHEEGHDAFEVLEHGPDTRGLTSIVIVSFNALDKTRKCLEALRNSANPLLATELLVVDNGSSDGSAEWLAEQPDLTLLRNAENRGAPAARNQALALARGAWIVVMDNDAIVSPGWLERLLFHAQVDARSGCIGPLSDRAAHNQQIEYDGPSDLDSLAAFARAHAERNHRRARAQNILTSLLLLMRREVVDTIGGFDERFSPWGFEDDDFTLRAALAGFRNRIALDVFVRHEHYGGAKAQLHNQLLARNWRSFASKWCGDGNVAYGDWKPIEASLKRELRAGELRVELPAAPRAALPAPPRLENEPSRCNV